MMGGHNATLMCLGHQLLCRMVALWQKANFRENDLHSPFWRLGKFVDVRGA
jgi:hypothetical protein